MPNVARVVVAVTLAAALLVGFALIGMIGDATEGDTEPVTLDATTLEGAGVWASFNDGTGTNETVYKTTGYAVNLTGADDSYVQSSENIEVSSDANWTISVWAYVDSEAAADNMTALSVNGRVIISYNGSAGNWSAWFYDEGSRDSYVVNVSDNGEQPGNFTNIIVRSNGSELSIYRNNTLGESKNITGSNIADAPINDTNWNGRLEEVRTFNESLNNSKRQELVDTPVEQQPDLDTTVRIMFDQPNESTQLLLYSPGHIEQSNVSFSAGFAEQIMDEKNAMNDLAGESDYVWDETGPRIKPVAGGELDGAPVAYADYTFEKYLTYIKHRVGDGLLLGSLVVLLMFAGMVLRVLRDT